MSLLPPPTASISPLVPLIVENLKNTGKNDQTIDGILAKEKKALTDKYTNEVKMQFHTKDLNEAYDRYKQVAEPIIDEINKLSRIAQNSNLKVKMARNNSGSNSEPEVAASSSASNAKIRMDELLGQLKINVERYQGEKKDADMTSAMELIKFLNLSVLSKTGGRRRTRKGKSSRKTRSKPRRKA